MSKRGRSNDLADLCQRASEGYQLSEDEIAAVTRAASAAGWNFKSGWSLEQFCTSILQQVQPYVVVAKSSRVNPRNRVFTVDIDLEIGNIPSQLYKAAAKTGSGDFFAYLNRQYEGDGAPYMYDIIEGAAEGHHLDILQKYYDGRYADALLKGAAKGGHLDLVQKALEHPESTDIDDAISNAQRNGHWHVVKYLQDRWSNQ